MKYLSALACFLICIWLGWHLTQSTIANNDGFTGLVTVWLFVAGLMSLSCR